MYGLKDIGNDALQHNIVCIYNAMNSYCAHSRYRDVVSSCVTIGGVH